MIYLYTTKKVDKLNTIEDLLSVLFNDSEYNYSFNQNLIKQPNRFSYDITNLLKCDAYDLFDLFIFFIQTNKPTLTDLCNASRTLSTLVNHIVISNKIWHFSTSYYHLSKLEAIPKHISKFKYFLMGQPTLIVHKINNKYCVVDYIDIE